MTSLRPPPRMRGLLPPLRHAQKSWSSGTAAWSAAFGRWERRLRSFTWSSCVVERPGWESFQSGSGSFISAARRPPSPTERSGMALHSPLTASRFDIRVSAAAAAAAPRVQQVPWIWCLGRPWSLWEAAFRCLGRRNLLATRFAAERWYHWARPPPRQQRQQRPHQGAQRRRRRRDLLRRLRGQSQGLQRLLQPRLSRLELPMRLLLRSHPILQNLLLLLVGFN